MVKIFEEFSSDVEDIKEKLLRSAINTGKVNILKFFVDKGYDVTDEDYDYLNDATDHIEIFEYILSKGVSEENLKDINDFSLKEKDIQSALVKHGHMKFLKDKVGLENLHTVKTFNL